MSVEIGPKVNHTVIITLDDEIVKAATEISNNQIEHFVAEFTQDFEVAAEEYRRSEESSETSI